MSVFAITSHSNLGKISRGSKRATYWFARAVQEMLALGGIKLNIGEAFMMIQLEKWEQMHGEGANFDYYKAVPASERSNEKAGDNTPPEDFAKMVQTIFKAEYDRAEKLSGMDTEDAIKYLCETEKLSVPVWSAEKTKLLTRERREMTDSEASTMLDGILEWFSAVQEAEIHPDSFKYEYAKPT